MSTNQVDRGAAPGVLAIPPRPVISDEVLNAADRLGVRRYLPAVIAFTVEIFGSYSDVQIVPDPEVPDWEQIIFNVPVTGEVEYLLDKGRRGRGDCTLLFRGHRGYSPL